MEKQVVPLPEAWGRTAYRQFLETEGLPVVTGLAVDDLRNLEVAPWARLDVKGAYIHLLGAEDTDSAYVVEIPSSASTAVETHLFEEVFFVISGRGTTEVWNQAGARRTFEWHTGSLFAIPLNASHRLHNGSGQEPARLLAVTTAPLMMNLVHNSKFIFNCPFDFTDRFTGQGDYFSGEGTLYGRADSGQKIWETNFVADVYRLGLHEWAERGGGGKHIKFELADNALVAHVSEFQVGMYKKAHRHGPGAHVVILEGRGYSLMWTDQSTTLEEVRWRPGTMFVPPGMWWHQHFNAGQNPARYLAIRWGSTKWRVTRYLDHQGIDKSAKEGGNQIEYADQAPQIHRQFVERCRENGVDVQMDQLVLRAG